MPTRDPVKKKLQAQRYYERNREKIRIYQRTQKRSRNEYNRAWRMAHPDAVRGYTQKNLLWNAAKLNEEKRKYYLKNRARLLKKQKEYYEANRDVCLQRMRVAAHKYRYARKQYNLKYRLANLEEVRRKAREGAKARYPQHREKLLAKAISDYGFRKSVIYEAGLADIEGVKQLVLKAKKSPFTKCFHCGTLLLGKPIHFDHLQPISRMGRHTPKNIAPSCATCNQSKKDKTLEEFAHYLSLITMKDK